MVDVVLQGAVVAEADAVVPAHPGATVDVPAGHTHPTVAAVPRATIGACGKRYTITWERVVDHLQSDGSTAHCVNSKTIVDHYHPGDAGGAWSKACQC